MLPQTVIEAEGTRLGWLERRLFGISVEETRFERRGFYAGEPSTRCYLELIGKTFLLGYHVALEVNDLQSIAHRLDGVEAQLRGFAFEGAAMGLTVLDHTIPVKRKMRLQKFLQGAGRHHAYMVHVGAGWAFARLPWLRRRIDGVSSELDPLLRWLTVDGYGFHQGYFYWRRYVREQVRPEQLSGYALRAFDQGLGRSLWFVEAADIGRIRATIASFPSRRQADLWSGVGLACGYAGGKDRPALESLLEALGPYRPHAAQGVTFAAKARQRAGNPASHTELACEVVCGLSADAAAALTDDALEGLPSNGDEPSYEVWRRRIQEQLVLRRVYE